MSTRHLKALIMALLIIACSAAVPYWQPSKHLTDLRPKIDLEALFPRQFGDWKVDNAIPVQMVAPDVQALLNKLYNQVLERTYVNSQGARIMLSVAYGGDQSDATRAHWPEVCYPAQGFEIQSSDIGAVQTSNGMLRVRRLVTKRGPRVEPLTYWVMVGDRVSLSGTEQKWRQMSYGFKGIIPDGMLVRVSSVSTELDSAFALQAGFIGDMAVAVAKSSHTRVFGDGT